ncbi:MAG TPA: hypothetical protein ENF56_00195 [Candidatus Bathyarchaeota archaeon]|nr:hypothetical protein [Candidatus Bathyarchaeota archaeon]
MKPLDAGSNFKGEGCKRQVDHDKSRQTGYKATTRRYLIGIFFILLSLSIVTVSAFVYQQANQTITQTIVEVATIKLSNIDLGSIDEGETKTYKLEKAQTIRTTKGHVYLHLDSNLDKVDTYYDTYDVVFIFSAVPDGSGHKPGDVACRLTISKPDYSSIDLDVPGEWIFDLEITTTAKSVNSDTKVEVTITVSAESTP